MTKRSSQTANLKNMPFGSGAEADTYIYKAQDFLPETSQQRCGSIHSGADGIQPSGYSSKSRTDSSTGVLCMLRRGYELQVKKQAGQCCASCMWCACCARWPEVQVRKQLNTCTCSVHFSLHVGTSVAHQWQTSCWSQSTYKCSCTAAYAKKHHILQVLSSFPAVHV